MGVVWGRSLEERRGSSAGGPAALGTMEREYDILRDNRSWRSCRSPYARRSMDRWLKASSFHPPASCSYAIPTPKHLLSPSLTLHIHSECDAPLTLINATFDWLSANFKGQVDFVVWTGDNARHDIDPRFPRSLPEIFKLNHDIAGRIKHTFGNVPVITSIGNNGACAFLWRRELKLMRRADIYPHNIMFGGREFLSLELG